MDEKNWVICLFSHQNISHMFGKICKFIRKILLSLFENDMDYSELRHQSLKIKDFSIVDSTVFLTFVPSIHER